MWNSVDCGISVLHSTLFITLHPTFIIESALCNLPSALQLEASALYDRRAWTALTTNREGGCVL
jgi:hypothetical protein